MRRQPQQYTSGIDQLTLGLPLFKENKAMAYLRKRKGTRGTAWEVLFYVASPKRHTVRLGRINERIANTAKIRIEALVAAKVAGHSLDAETVGWAASLHDVIHQRLAQAGLVERRTKDEQNDPSAPRLARHIEKYIASRAKLKPNTIRNYTTTKRLLMEYFGQERLLQSIHTGHAKDYREWLVGKYAPATVSREIKRGRQFFEYAKDCHVITENPFAKVKAGSQKNTKRKHFVSPDVIQKVLEACPDNNWRLALVLTRFGGLRIPSEVSRLTWGDVDCMTADSPYACQRRNTLTATRPASCQYSLRLSHTSDRLSTMPLLVASMSYPRDSTARATYTPASFVPLSGPTSRGGQNSSSTCVPAGRRN